MENQSDLITMLTIAIQRYTQYIEFRAEHKRLKVSLADAKDKENIIQRRKIQNELKRLYIAFLKSEDIDIDNINK